VKIGQVMVDMDAAGYRVALQVHDEIAAVVRREQARQAEAALLESMRVSPEWMPYLPLDAEVGIARRYGDAK
jgi:DNA polymerase I-like protein with 3'-5' exonuclease and polymerase domains